MKGQWGLILALIFILIIAIFSVINVDPVSVNYLFGTAEWPLILVIISSVILGALFVGSIGMVKIYRLQRALKKAQNENESSEPNIDQHIPENFEIEESNEQTQVSRRSRKK
ncbi:putative integral membrane protein [Scopulibacillus darangshiensis]|uniref:Putative integral membrane protein n=1 Tax=Scopulibacillus darangshiensis TaxID=442528 RepID=A0A4R2PBA9_9BACL|nr:lipopolysaccharide assembly protein LapA domain-containing protein [Scopulibacillus darangshiensis]TCP32267.1 putative integral membrane protein [Scopulibacillus darangshiensis]